MYINYLYILNKRDCTTFDLVSIPFIMILPLAECPTTLSWLAEILELRENKILFELRRSKGGMKDIFCIS